MNADCVNELFLQSYYYLYSYIITWLQIYFNLNDIPECDSWKQNNHLFIEKKQVMLVCKAFEYDFPLAKWGRENIVFVLFYQFKENSKICWFLAWFDILIL